MVGMTFTSNNSSPYSGYVTTTDSLSTASANFSAELWFQGTAATSTLWQLNTAQTGAAGTAIARILISSSTVVDAQIWNGSAFDTVTGTVGSGVNLTDGQPHHIVFTYATAATGTYQLFVDGVLLTSGTALGTIDSTTVYNWIYDEFAINPGVSSQWISRVAFYNGTNLSQSQVSNHFNAAINISIAAYDALVVSDGGTYYWKLIETSGTSAADSIGSNTGTYTNTAYLTYAVSNPTIILVGSPAIAQSRPSYLALQYQNLRYRTPLSNGGIGVEANGSSGGGGITVGGGGGGGKLAQTF
jgi:hypothetical protein